MDELIYKKWKPTIQKNGICDNYIVQVLSIFCEKYATMYKDNDI